MTDTKMLQILIDGQTSLKKDVRGGQSKIRKEMKKGFEKVNSRINALGNQLNVLDEDAPTRDEFENLETRVISLEKRDTSN